MQKEDVGTVNFDEFITIVAPKVSARDPRAEIMKVQQGRDRSFCFPWLQTRTKLRVRPTVHIHAQIFDLFDEDSTGTITFRDLKRVATELGEKLSEEEMRV